MTNSWDYGQDSQQPDSWSHDDYSHDSSSLYPMPYDTPASSTSAGYPPADYGQPAPYSQPVPYAQPNAYQQGPYAQPNPYAPVPYAQPGPLYPGMPGYGIDPKTGLPFSSKSKLVAGLLNIFLPIGIGRLYKGDIGIGIAQLLIGVFLGWLWFPLLWSFIDGIIMLATPQTDSNGLPLKD